MLDTGKPRKRKTTAQPETEADEAGRRQMDARLAETWERLFAFQGEQVAELVRTVRGSGGTLGLTERMTRLETVLSQMVTTLAEQKAMLAEMHELLQGLALSAKAEKTEQPAAEQKKPEETQVITKGALALMAWENLKPILVALAAWLLLTLGPQLIALLWAP